MVKDDTLNVKKSAFGCGKKIFALDGRNHSKSIWGVKDFAVSSSFHKAKIALLTSSYYKHHVFFCVNQREEGKRCCADFDSTACRDHAKARLKEKGMHGPGKVRINQAGCLDRCEEGPVLVVYPDEVWYSYVDTEDVDEIIDRHLVQGEVVDRLKI